MIGASRDSLAKVAKTLFSRKGDLSTLSAELFGIASVISSEKALRQKLADSGLSVAMRQGLINDIFAKKVSKVAVETLNDIAAGRWSTDGDLVEAVETLAAQALFVSSDNAKKLDKVADEIFGFGRLVDSSAQLQMALTDPATSGASKAALVESLLGKKVESSTLSVLKYFAANLRGRRVDAVVELLVTLAAAQAGSIVAEVTSAIELEKSQKERLEKALAKLTGKSVRINVAVEANVIGGISVRIGQEIIDGTFATRLEQARRSLLA